MTLEQLKGLVADLARPFSIVATSLSAAVVPVIVVGRTSPDHLDLVAAAALVGALYAGVGALYWGKAWEQVRSGGHAAEVEKAKAAVTPPAGTAAVIAAPDVDVQVREADDVGGEDPTLYGGPRQ